MNRTQLLRSRKSRVIRNKKNKESRIQKAKEKLIREIGYKKWRDVVDESRWNTFYVILKKEVEKSEYATFYRSLLDDMNTMYCAIYKFRLITYCNENIFASQPIKDEFLSLFSKAQKKYNSLARLKYRYMFNKAEYRNDVDMLLSPIDSTMKNVIIVFNENSKYLFRIQEMNKIFKTALCNYDEFETALPLPCKNPYNNVPFSKAQLINIYNQMLYSTCQIDPMVTYYYNAGFSLSLLYKNNYINMNEQYIKDRYNNLYDKRHIIREVKEMVNYLNDITNGDIKFPKNDDMYMDLKPYLQLYYKSEYSTDDYVKQRTLQELKYRMKCILNANPKYGRRIRKKKKTIDFNTEHGDGPFSFQKSKPKYEEMTSLERCRFHYHNTLDGWFNSHENNRFVYLDEFPYEDIANHETRVSRITPRSTPNLTIETHFRTETPGSLTHRMDVEDASYDYDGLEQGLGQRSRPSDEVAEELQQRPRPNDEIREAGTGITNSNQQFPTSMDAMLQNYITAASQQSAINSVIDTHQTARNVSTTIDNLLQAVRTMQTNGGPLEPTLFDYNAALASLDATPSMTQRTQSVETPIRNNNRNEELEEGEVGEDSDYSYESDESGESDESDESDETDEATIIDSVIARSRNEDIEDSDTVEYIDNDKEEEIDDT